MPRQMLLHVLEEASVAEVVDVSTEIHQLWVDVIGHTVVGGHGVADDGWHHEGGGAVAHTLPTAFYQGTKSGQSTNTGHQTTVFKKHKNNKSLRTEKNLLFMLNIVYFLLSFKKTAL